MLIGFTVFHICLYGGDSSKPCNVTKYVFLLRKTPNPHHWAIISCPSRLPRVKYIIHTHTSRGLSTLHAAVEKKHPQPTGSSPHGGVLPKVVWRGGVFNYHGGHRAHREYIYYILYIYRGLTWWCLKLPRW